MPMFLHLLPLEIVVLILKHVDVSTVTRFRQTSKSCLRIVDAAQEEIYESIADRILNIFVPRTAGDSGITRDTIDYKHLRGIERAINCQRTASRCYDDCNSWKKLGKL